MEKLVTRHKYFNSINDAQLELNKLKSENPDFIHIAKLINNRLVIESMNENQYVENKVSRILNKKPIFSFRKIFGK